jgi:hypothetical protein
MLVDIAVVGAGIAGLSCARELSRGGRSPVVVERSRGPGGRCATRRVHGQPLDHGVIFLHGAHPEFLAELDAVDTAGRLDGWPSRIEGRGTPCQPRAFEPRQRRLVYVEGVTAFPKHLARGVEVRRETRVASLGLEGERFTLRLEPAGELKAREVVLALALEQSLALLDSLRSDDPELRAARRLLTLLRTLPCLTVLAGYSSDALEPSWDVLYPEDSSLLMLVSHDSSKRREKRFLSLVYQCHPRWSRLKLEEPPEGWRDEVLREASRLLGSWAGSPQWVETHRWRFARMDPTSELAQPMLLRFPGGQRLGLAGELFSPGGGLEAAWVSGRKLGRRFLEERE